MYSYIIRMSLVCTRTSSVYHSYILVCHLCVTCMYSYVTLIHSYVICISLVCTLMPSVCHSYVVVYHLYVTRMYSYVIRMSLVCTRMSSVCHSYVPVCHSYVTRMWFFHEPVPTLLLNVSILAPETTVSFVNCELVFFFFFKSFSGPQC